LKKELPATFEKMVHRFNLKEKLAAFDDDTLRRVPENRITPEGRVNDALYELTLKASEENMEEIQKVL